MAVALEQLLGQRAHLLRPEARIDAQVLERPVEPLHVLLHLEQAMAEAARHVEAAVAVHPARITEGDAHLALRDELAVEPRDPLVATYRHVSPSRETTTAAARPPRLTHRQCWNRADQVRSSSAGA